MDKTIGIIETRLVWKESFEVVGEKIKFEPAPHVPHSENAIAQLWPRFSNRAGEIPHMLAGTYGLCLQQPHSKPGEPFDYVAAVRVSQAGSVPQGMCVETVPAGLYAVITRKGRIDEIGTVYGYYWDTWLPESGYTPRSGAEIEYYDDRYLGNENPDSVMELWFPVGPAGGHEA